jgi:hypothetical protein
MGQYCSIILVSQIKLSLTVASIVLGPKAIFEAGYRSHKQGFVLGSSLEPCWNLRHGSRSMRSSIFDRTWWFITRMPKSVTRLNMTRMDVHGLACKTVKRRSPMAHSKLCQLTCVKERRSMK